MPRQIPSRALHTRFFSPSFPSLPSLPSLPSSSLPSRSVISTTRQAWMAIPSSPRFFSGTRIPTVQSSIAKRAFSTSRAGWVRQTYFPRSGGSGGSGGDGRSWFSNMRRRIDALPTMVVVSWSGAMWQKCTGEKSRGWKIGAVVQCSTQTFGGSYEREEYL